MNNHVKQILPWLGTGSINLFGSPFAGKDTQGHILAGLLGGKLIAGGDILRSYPDKEEIGKVMSVGELIPTDFYLKIIAPYLSQPEFNDKPLVLSAVGRLKGEETSIIEAANNTGHPIKAVVLLNLSEEEVWKRFEAAQTGYYRGSRADDKRETLATRLDIFRNKTMPVISFYREQGLLLEVDGTKPREEVTQDILEALVHRACE